MPNKFVGYNFLSLIAQQNDSCCYFSHPDSCLVSDSGFAYQTGPTVYCSRTVFEDATHELVRDFFWDDEFRPKWDPMLTYCKILEECPQTGTMIVHWIKKVCGTKDLGNCMLIPCFPCISF